jgi:hypothetical protein
MIASCNCFLHIRDRIVIIRTSEKAIFRRIRESSLQIYPRDRSHLIGFNSPCRKIKSTRIEFPRTSAWRCTIASCTLSRITAVAEQQHLQRQNIEYLRAETAASCGREKGREREREKGERERKGELVRSTQRGSYRKCSRSIVGAASGASQRAVAIIVVVVVVVAAFCSSSGVEPEAKERERERERGVGERRRGKREGEERKRVISDVAVAAFIPLARTTLHPRSRPCSRHPPCGLSAATPPLSPPPPLPSAGAQSRATTEIRLAIIVDDKVEQCRTPRHEDVRA